MPTPMLECVPNFSEGRNPEIIQKIAEAIRQVTEVELLHVDIGFDTHRTVMTFAGAPSQVIEAAFNAIKQASELIDMRTQKGAHPRMGATDVCPLIPLKNISMQEAIHWSKILGERVASELNIPVYLYENSATKEARINLANIRKGEYEGFQSKILLPEWKPDFGKAEMNEKSGCIAIGARELLVAFNIALNTNDVSIAKKIAAIIRESNSYEHQHELPLSKLKGVKAIGWYLPEFGCAQVSMNITRLNETPVHDAFEAVKSAALEFGVSVTGSELVGMIPINSLTDAGKYFLKNENIETSEAIDAAIEYLLLNGVKPFKAEERILEYGLQKLKFD